MLSSKDDSFNKNNDVAHAEAILVFIDRLVVMHSLGLNPRKTISFTDLDLISRSYVMKVFGYSKDDL